MIRTFPRAGMMVLQAYTGIGRVDVGIVSSKVRRQLLVGNQ